MAERPRARIPTSPPGATGAGRGENALLEALRRNPDALVGAVSQDASAGLVDLPASLHALLGAGHSRVEGSSLLELVDTVDQLRVARAWRQARKVGTASCTAHLKERGVSRRLMFFDLRAGHGVMAVIFVDDGAADLVEALKVRQQLLEQVTTIVPVGLLQVDRAGRFVYANDAFTGVTGLGAGDSLGDWRELVTRRHRPLLDHLFDLAHSGQSATQTVEMAGPDGEERFCTVGVQALIGTGGQPAGATAVVEDTTARVLERRELQALAVTDSLTGCLNHTATLVSLQRALDQIESDPRAGGVAVIFVDIDGLKLVNDTMGHHVGDAVIKEIAERLRAAVRAQDSVGRVGGDEFVIVAARVRTAEDALSVARWVSGRVRGDVEVAGEKIALKASIGVAWTSDPAASNQALLRAADEAMYVSKREGEGRPSMAYPLAGGHS